VALLLLIEDDLNIRSALTRALTQRGHAVASEPDGMRGLQKVLDEPPDLVVLDLGLPDLDGIQLLRMLRPVSSVPVIVATARDDDTMTVAALDAGADDYIVKPFSAEQLDARIRAVLRRTSSPSGGTGHRLEVGDLVIDLRARTAVLAGILLDLRPREFDLLAYLAARPGEVVTKRNLLVEVWQSPYGGADKTVDVHLSWLRRKLGETAAEPRLLHTVRGVGVKLMPSGTAEGEPASPEPGERAAAVPDAGPDPVADPAAGPAPDRE
jgi:two-component system KDP operon response regulator KdpE